VSVLITNNLNEAINIEGYIKNLGSHQNTILSDESYKELISNSKIFNDLLNNKYITCIVNDKITFTINKTISTTNNTTNIDNTVTTVNVDTVISVESDTKVNDKPKTKTTRKSRKTRLLESNKE
jgi:nitrogen regulatory protein PII